MDRTPCLLWPLPQLYGTLDIFIYWLIDWSNFVSWSVGNTQTGHFLVSISFLHFRYTTLTKITLVYRMPPRSWKSQNLVLWPKYSKIYSAVFLFVIYTVLALSLVGHIVCICIWGHLNRAYKFLRKRITVWQHHFVLNEIRIWLLLLGFNNP